MPVTVCCTKNGYTSHAYFCAKRGATALSRLISRRGTSGAGLTNREGPLLNGVAADSLPGKLPMDTETSNFVRAGSLEELKAKGRLVVHGRHRPVLLVHEDGRVFAFDNRCPHMGFPLDRGSIEDGILTCHWHHARFELASGCTFDLWADDVPTCPVETSRHRRWWGRSHCSARATATVEIPG
jgi:nitrite reductase/ring-hydroxylating ferredoxin subunit